MNTIALKTIEIYRKDLPAILYALRLVSRRHDIDEDLRKRCQKVLESLENKTDAIPCQIRREEALTL